MKKIISLVLLIMIVVPVTIKAEETLGDIQNELSELENDYEKKQAELENNQLEYDQLYDELTSVAEEKEKTKNTIQTIENDIKIKEAEIKDLNENQIPAMEKKAKVSLKFSQQNLNENILLSIVYNSIESSGGSLLETIKSTSIVISELNQSLFDLLDLLEQVEIEEANLEFQREQLKIKEEELQTQEEYLTELKNKVAEQIAKIEGDLSEQNDVIAAAKEKEKIFEEAGCKPDDVYGVDCAKKEIPQSSGQFSRPLASGVVTNEFGADGWTTSDSYVHSGIDLANSEGTPIYPTTSGKVLYAGPTGDGGGNSVVMIHAVGGTNYISRYCHMSSISVSTGDSIKEGQTIGGLGATGNTAGAHLHFEIQQGATYDWFSLENPRDYVSFPGLGEWW